MSLMLALVLSSCGNPTPLISPPNGALPEHAVLYLRADTFTVLDVKGAAPVVTELFRHGAVTGIRFEAPIGTEFSLGATAGPEVKRFGPYTIAAIPEPPSTAPELTFVNRSWKTDAVFLGFEVELPAYRVEMKPEATVVLLKGETFIGYESCPPQTWKWKGPVELRIAGLSPTGKPTAFTEWIHVRPPLGSRASSVDYAFDWLRDRWLELLGLAASITALIVFWRRRRVRS